MSDEAPTHRRHVMFGQRDVCVVIETRDDVVALIVDDRIQLNLSQADARALGVKLLLSSHDARDAAP